MNHKLNYAFLLGIVLATLPFIACSISDATYKSNCPEFSEANPTPHFLHMETRTASLSESVQLRLDNYNHQEPRSAVPNIANVTQGALILQ